MSTKRTPVQLVAIEAVAGAEATDLALDASLLSLKSREFLVVLGERAQILGDETAHRATALCRTDAGGTIDILWNGDGDVGHCVSQYHMYTVHSNA